MKTGTKLTIFAAVLCVVSIAALVSYLVVHQSRLPGKFGRNLEFRLLAVNAQNQSQVSGESTTRSGDTFSGADAQKWIANGDTPSGWKWLPVIDSLQASTMAGLGAGEISRSNDGREQLLVSDSGEMALTHRADAPSWGVKSAEAHSGESGPAVAIILDKTGGELMYQLTQKHIGRSMAVVVDGKICMVAKTMTPIRDAIEVTLPQGQLREAEDLRNLLMSGRN